MKNGLYTFISLLIQGIIKVVQILTKSLHLNESVKLRLMLIRFETLLFAKTLFYILLLVYIYESDRAILKNCNHTLL